MPSMNHSNLSSKWNSRYVQATVLHSTTLTEFQDLLGHNVSIITSALSIKFTQNYVLKF
jgi:hypothetical protein